MITQDSPINKQIAFYEDKINHYCDVIKSNPKGEEINKWLEWIKSWNQDIIILKNRISNNNYNECLDCGEKISKPFITCWQCYLKNKETE